MKKILFLLLLTVASYGQVSTGQEQEFDYGIKNNSTQTVTTPTYLTTTGTDGTQGKIPSALVEKTDNKQNSLVVDGTGTKYPTVDAVNAALPVTYTTIVYVNAASPTTATIFDDENPPTVNDDALKINTANLYIGTDASTWVYNGSAYVTKVVPATSNFFIRGTTTDAGNSKTENIERIGGIKTSQTLDAGNVNTGNVIANNFIKSGGTSSQFLKADGSVDSSSFTLVSNSEGHTYNNSATYNVPTSMSESWFKIYTGGFLPTVIYLSLKSDYDNSLDNNHVVVTLAGYGMKHHISSSTSNYNDSRLLEIKTNEPTSGSGGVVEIWARYGSSSINTGTITIKSSASIPTLTPATPAFNGTNIVSILYKNNRENNSMLITRGIQIDGNNVWHAGNLTNPITGTGTANYIPKLTSAGGLGDSQIFDNGNILIGTTTDNAIDKLQVNGTISASPATTSSQVVVKSQLDAKADLASPALTGTPTAPTAAVGTTGNQIATVDFVQGEKQNLQSVLDNGFVANKSIILENLPLQVVSTSSSTYGIYGAGGITLKGANDFINNIQGSFINSYNGTKSTSINMYRSANGSVEYNFNPDKLSGNYNIATLDDFSKKYTVSSLPTPTGSEPVFAIVTDATAPTYLGTLTGGGSVVCPVFYNGTAWVAH